MKKIILLLILFLSANSYSQNKIETENLDIRIFRSINNSRSPFLDKFISITDKSVFPIAALTPVTLFVVSRANKNVYDENSSVLLGASEVTSLGVVLALKNIVKRERPFKVLDNVYYKKDNSPTDEYSFPSSHTATAFSMATSLTLRYTDKPILIAGAFTYAAIVSYGRIYLGVHYPSDVLAGAVIGAGSSALIFSLRKEILKAKSSVFGETYSDNRDNNGISEYAALGGLVGVTAINNLFSHSKNPILRKTNLSTDLSSLSIRINF